MRVIKESVNDRIKQQSPQSKQSKSLRKASPNIQQALPTIKKASEVCGKILVAAGISIVAASGLAFLAAKITIALPIFVAVIAVGVTCLAVGVLLYVTPKALAYYYERKVHMRPDQRMLYHKVCDSGHKIKELEGSTYLQTLSSIIDDLQDYKGNGQGNSKYSFDQLIKELEFARDIDAANFRYLPRIFTKFYNRNEHMAKEISEKIKQLKTGEGSVILPGGSKDHAVLYQIKRESDVSLSFTVIDTSTHVNQSKHYQVPNNLEGRNSKFGYTYNPTYVDLSDEQLSKEVILEMLNKNYCSTFMTSLNFLHEKLRNNDSSNIKYKYTQRLQHNGTCSMKSILALLRNELGEQEYRNFKVFMTERELNKGKSRTSSFKKTVVDFLFHHGQQTMLDLQLIKTGDRILSKRKSKI